MNGVRLPGADDLCAVGVPLDSVDDGHEVLAADRMILVCQRRFEGLAHRLGARRRLAGDGDQQGVWRSRLDLSRETDNARKLLGSEGDLAGAGPGEAQLVQVENE